MGEEVIRKIIELDKKTSDMVLSYHEKSMEQRAELRDYLIQLENKSNEDAKRLGQEAYEKSIEEAKKKVEEINHANQEKLKSIEINYEKYEKELLEEAFQQFVLKNNE